MRNILVISVAAKMAPHENGLFSALEAAGVHKSVQSVKQNCSGVTCEFQRFFPDQFRPPSQKLQPIEILNFEVPFLLWSPRWPQMGHIGPQEVKFFYGLKLSFKHS